MHLHVIRVVRVCACTIACARDRPSDSCRASTRTLVDTERPGLYGSLSTLDERASIVHALLVPTRACGYLCAPPRTMLQLGSNRFTLDNAPRHHQPLCKTHDSPGAECTSKPPVSCRWQPLLVQWCNPRLVPLRSFRLLWTNWQRPPQLNKKNMLAKHACTNLSGSMKMTTSTTTQAGSKRPIKTIRN